MQGGAFPYTEAVFKEAMRVYPPSVMAMRQSPATPWSLGGYELPPGTALQVRGRIRRC